MPQKADGKSGKEPITFTRLAAERIARAVRKSEHGPREAAPFGFGVRLQDVGRSAGLRHVEWTGQWAAAETATFTFKSSNATATGVNVFAGVDAGSGWVARHSGTWHLVVCNLTTQPNYASGDVQMLGHNDNGILRWYSITTCATATASP
jgi:hypothetical protein